MQVSKNPDSVASGLSLPCLQMSILGQAKLFKSTRVLFEYLNTLYVLKTKETEFANSMDLDEVAHFEPPHLDLRCLPSSL